MNEVDNDAVTVEVKEKGLNCSLFGYVESKSSSTKGDHCAMQSSFWGVNYAFKEMYRVKKKDSNPVNKTWDENDPNFAGEKVHLGVALTSCSKKPFQDNKIEIVRNSAYQFSHPSDARVCTENNKNQCSAKIAHWEEGTTRPLYFILNMPVLHEFVADNANVVFGG